MANTKTGIAIAALAALAAVASVPMVPTNITLSWNPQADVDSFYLYGSTNLNAPMPWPAVTNTPGTNSQITIQILPSQQFFYLTASNFWGESGPSNTVRTPPSVAAGAVAIRKGP